MRIELNIEWQDTTKGIIPLVVLAKDEDDQRVIIRLITGFDDEPTYHFFSKLHGDTAQKCSEPLSFKECWDGLASALGIVGDL